MLAERTALRLACKAFCLTHEYDGAICDYLMAALETLPKA
jgi:phosphoribosylaminoimidazolecarboxamide formyltransferase/IMP cyclohydrolase